jgi:urease beta subunit
MLRIAGALALLLAPSTLHAESYRSSYSVTFLGIPIASSSFVSSFEEDRFDIEGTLQSTGIASIFDDVKGKVTVSGRFAKDRTEALSFRLDYTADGKAKSTAIRFEDGNVVSTENVPPLKKRSKRWVPLSEDDLRTVLDPISATLVRASGPDDVCNRTVKVYDGEMRVDIRLVPDETASGSSMEGAVTCAVRFEPVAGYRKGKKAIEFLRKEARIVVSLAPVGDHGVYAPVYASVGTRYGPVTVEASDIELVE